MQYTRQHVVDVLRRSGLPQEADEAAASLPDPATWEQIQAFCREHGLSTDQLVSRMGGSP
jgi:hypothetical protein